MHFAPQGWVPDWPVPARVQAFFTTRHEGVSGPPWHSLNLGDHVGDEPLHVAANRQRLSDKLLAHPVFLQQVHETQVVHIDERSPAGLRADACWTAQAGVACTIMVADCLPVLFADPKGRWVAAAHAGWRGLAGFNGEMDGPNGRRGSEWGVLETTLQQVMGAAASPDLKTSEIHAWLGPCIGPQAFEVGGEVRDAFCHTLEESQAAFVPYRPGTFLANLALLARLRLHRAGVTSIHGNDGSPQWCTYGQESLFFSHRRDAAVLGSTGRMAACIWLQAA